MAAARRRLEATAAFTDHILSQVEMMDPSDV